MARGNLRFSRSTPLLQAGKGFTLIELMVVCAIIAILAAIAIPAYGDYIKRSHIIEATSRLSDIRVRVEQFYLDNRTYALACALGTSAGNALVNAGNDVFTLACNPAPDATTYTIVATGNAGIMNGFQYSINQNNVHSTVAVPAGWSLPAINNCWATRKDGTCG